MNDTFYKRMGKRTFDLLGATCGLVILTPFLLIIAALVKVTSRGPVFFRQTRVGHFGKRFRICKFRSMTASSTGRGALLTEAGDPRITHLGRWLRKSKVDELPQLINVFLGQMSFVGPRPEVPEYVANYAETERRVLTMKPGVTGLVAMNNFREEGLLAAQRDKDHFYRTVLLPAKLKLDLAYCEDVRFSRDLKIILATLFRIFWKPARRWSSVVPIPE